MASVILPTLSPSLVWEFVSFQISRDRLKHLCVLSTNQFLCVCVCIVMKSGHFHLWTFSVDLVGLLRYIQRIELSFVAGHSVCAVLILCLLYIILCSQMYCRSKNHKMWNAHYISHKFDRNAVKIQIDFCICHGTPYWIQTNNLCVFEVGKKRPLNFICLAVWIDASVKMKRNKSNRCVYKLRWKFLPIIWKCYAVLGMKAASCCRLYVFACELMLALCVVKVVWIMCLNRHFTGIATINMTIIIYTRCHSVFRVSTSILHI